MLQDNNQFEVTHFDEETKEELFIESKSGDEWTDLGPSPRTARQQKLREKNDEFDDEYEIKIPNSNDKY